MSVTCTVYDCKFCINYECEYPGGPTISDDELTAAGFLPMCKSFEEMGGEQDGN